MLGLSLSLRPAEPLRAPSLSAVWLAVWEEKKLTKAQVLSSDLTDASENVEKSVDDVGLRVAGKLLVGMARVFLRKATYLASDCAEAVVSLRAAFRGGAELSSTEAVAKKKAITIANFDDVDPDLDLDVPFDDEGKKRPLVWAEDAWAEAAATKSTPFSKKDAAAAASESLLFSDQRRASTASSIEIMRGGKDPRPSLGGVSDTMDDLDPVGPDDIGQYLSAAKHDRPSLGPIIDDIDLLSRSRSDDDDEEEDDSKAEDSKAGSKAEESSKKKRKTALSPREARRRPEEAAFVPDVQPEEEEEAPPPPAPMMDDDDDFDHYVPPPPLDDDDVMEQEEASSSRQPPVGAGAPPSTPAEQRSERKEEWTTVKERHDPSSPPETKKKRKGALLDPGPTQLDKRTVKTWLANTKPILADPAEAAPKRPRLLRPVLAEIPDVDNFALNEAGEAAKRKPAGATKGSTKGTPDSSTVSSIERFRFAQPSPEPERPRDVDDDDDDFDFPPHYAPPPASPPRSPPPRGPPAPPQERMPSLGVIDDLDLMDDDDVLGAFSPGSTSASETSPRRLASTRRSRASPPPAPVEREWHPNTVKVAKLLKESLADGGFLSFDGLTAAADKQTTVGVFVELLHLKSWDFIHLTQGGSPPEGDISVTPARSFDDPIPDEDGGGDHHDDDDDDNKV